MGAWEYLEQLTAWPHRGSTSAYEAEAARWLAETLRSMGYAVAVEPFRAPAATLYAGPPLVGAVVAAAVAVALAAPGPWATTVAAVVALGAVALLLQEALLLRPAFDRILPLRSSQNVVAVRPGATGTGPLVLVVAHYDTQRGSWLFAPWFRRGLPVFFKLAYGGVALAVVGLLAGAVAGWLGTGWTTWRWVAAAGAALTVVTMGWLALAGWRGRPVNGANDNGSGTAVVLALAERWADRASCPDVEVRFLLTGSEEVGTRGMWAYLDAHPELKVRPVYVVNVDNVGGGSLRALRHEGMVLPVPCGRRLGRLVEALVQEGRLSWWDRMLLLSTDAGPAAVRGHEVITFIGLDERGGIPHYHWFSDMIRHVDRDHLARVADTIGSFIDRLVSELSEGTPSRPGV
ncbi:MAG TPA: M28 family peptidase [Limnochordales bacterium]